MAGGFASTFSKASNMSADLQKRMSELGQNQNQIAAFGRLQTSATQTSEKLNATRGRVRELGEQMRATANPSAQLQRQFTSANVESNRLQNRLMDQRRELGQLRTTLTAAGIDTRNFSNEQARLVQSTQQVAQAANMQRAQERLHRAQSNFNDSRQRLSWRNMRGELMTSAGIILALRAPIQQAAEFEQAMTRVRISAGATGEEFERLVALSRELGRGSQFTATQIAGAQASLANAGFNSGDIQNAIPGLLNMAAAGEMDLGKASEMATALIRGFGLGAEDVERVADVLAQASISTRSNITTLGASMQNIAPLASGLGISFEQTAAMIGVMENAGIKGAEASRTLEGALKRLSREPREVQNALNGMGIALTDQRGNLRTIPSLLQALHARTQNMGSQERMQVFSQVFGANAVPGMMRLMEATTNGSNALQELELAYANAAGASRNMAGEMNATAHGAMRRLSTSMNSLMLDIGNVMLPSFITAADALGRFTSGASEFAQRFPAVTNALVLGVSALGVYKVAVTVTSIAWTAAKLPFQHAALVLAKLNARMVLNGHASMFAATKVKAFAVAKGIATSAIKISTTAVKAWTAAQWLLNVALKANPIGLVIMGIASLVAAGYWLYQSWETISAGISAVWNVGWGAVTSVASGAISLISGDWTSFKSWFADSDFANNVWDGLTSGWASAQSFISSGWDTVRNSFVGDWASGAWDWTRSFVGWSGSDDGVIDEAMLAAQLNDINMLNKMSTDFADRVQSMHEAWLPFKESLGDGFRNVFNLMTQTGGMIRTVVIPAVNELSAALSGIASDIQAVASAGRLQVNVSAAQPAASQSSSWGWFAHAAGGIFSTPHLGLVAEAGAEAIIPLTDRSRGVPLWLAAGEAMGMKFGGNTTTNNVSRPAPNINITVHGGDQSVARDIAEEVKRVLRDLYEYDDRTQLA